MNFLHEIIVVILPYLMYTLELIGIFIVFWTCIKAFVEYIQNAFFKKHLAIQTHLSKGLATGLEFKLGAEILKTVVVHDLEELLIVGAVFVLRALMSILIHYELKHSEQHGD